MKNLLITGGAGFIGSHVVRLFVTKYPDYHIINLDMLTYAGNLENLKDIDALPNYTFIKGDITDGDLINKLFETYPVERVVHLTAESHVDRSITDPAAFIRTNIFGTFNLVHAAKEHWKGQMEGKRFYHISTDEVYGSLGETGLFTETTSYDPKSPYSASKASSDHLVRAYFNTFHLPVLISNCSNNYGPFHFPEKLIPLVILNALDGKPLPVYGDGKQIRDWLFVDDHARALLTVVETGKIGETYNIGGHNEQENIHVVRSICDILDELHPQKPNGINHYQDLITFVKDRPGHDLRYAIDAGKIAEELGWTPKETFETGLRKTVQWYLDNMEWCRHVQDGSYRRERLGLGE